MIADTIVGQMDNPSQSDAGSIDELDEVEGFICKGADRLFKQFEKSNGYTSLGDSQLAEAAIVVHIASSASQCGHAVWPESPFRESPKATTKHIDMLIDLHPDTNERPILVTLEGKAVSGSCLAMKAKEIVRDHGRVCEWNRLDETGIPLFYAFNRPRQVYGVLVVLCTEDLDSNLQPQPGSFSTYWADLTGTVSGLEADSTEALRSRLKKAIRRDVVRCSYKDGGICYSVAYAIFKSTAETSGELRDTAEHEAAHAVVAVKCSLSVSGIALVEQGPLRGGVVCDWKARRGSIADRELVVSSFALGYAGAIIDMERTRQGIGQTIGSLKWDKASIEDSRLTAVAWSVVPTVEETGALSSEGFRRASALVSDHRHLIQDLADVLMIKKSLDQQEFAAWYAAAQSSSRQS